MRCEVDVGDIVIKNIDVDWINSETDEYGSWTDRNSLYGGYYD